ncbi:MAG: hypothetical protein RL154_1477 [Pseudomonadota bacterium]|jgi:sulfate transport system permease protein
MIKAIFLKNKNALPGFSATLGFGLFYISLLLLIPLAALTIKSANGGFDAFIAAAFSERAVAAYELSFSASFIAATINAILGFCVAWILARYDFYGKSLVDALVDMPFALPTAVAGITLTTLYASTGLIGEYLEKIGIQGAFSYFGIVIALIFVGVPFTIRTLIPAIKDLPVEIEEAAETLGARGFQIFWRVIIPSIWIAWISGFTLSFARAIGEYGSVVFIAGNIPFKTEIAPLIIITKLEQYNYSEASAIAVVMLFISLFLLVLTDYLSKRISGGRD